MKLKKGKLKFKGKIGKAPKKNKFSIKNRPEPKPEGQITSNKSAWIMPVADMPIYDVCLQIKEAGYSKILEEGDRFYWPGEKDEVKFFSIRDIEALNASEIAQLNRNAVWRPSVEDVFQILREEYDFYPITCSSGRSYPNVALAFTKMRLQPKTELLGVIQAKAASLPLAACICLNEAVSGNVTEKWKTW